MRREFTVEEIAEIEVNPNTYEVTGKTLRLTGEAKEKIMLLREEGHSAMYIFKALGYNTETLGEDRINKIVKRVAEQAQSKEGIHEGYKKRKSKRMDLNELKDLEPGVDSIKSLKNEVLYLRQEVDFLKNCLSWRIRKSEAVKHE